MEENNLKGEISELELTITKPILLIGMGTYVSIQKCKALKLMFSFTLY